MSLTIMFEESVRVMKDDISLIVTELFLMNTYGEDTNSATEVPSSTFLILLKWLSEKETVQLTIFVFVNLNRPGEKISMLSNVLLFITTSWMPSSLKFIVKKMKVIRETELRKTLLLIVIFVNGGIGHLKATCSTLIEIPPALSHLASMN